MCGRRLGPGGDVRPRARIEQRLVLKRLFGIDDHGQRVVVDDDQLGGVDSRRPVLADHDRDDLAHEADDVLRHHGAAHALWEAERRRPEGRQADVVRSEDLHAGERLGRTRVDAVDLRVREQRANEGDGGGTLRHEILDVPPLAAEEAVVLRPQDPVPEDAHGGSLPPVRLPSRDVRSDSRTAGARPRVAVLSRSAGSGRGWACR
jgi:hypothetical protein